MFKLEYNENMKNSYKRLQHSTIHYFRESLAKYQLEEHSPLMTRISRDLHYSHPNDLPMGQQTYYVIHAVRRLVYVSIISYSHHRH